MRLAALVVVGGAVPFYGAQAYAAVSAGAIAALGEIVDVLVGVVPIVELTCVAAAAQKLAMVGTPVQWVISATSQAVRLPLHTNRVSRPRQVRDPSTVAMNLSQRARSESVGGGHFSSPGRLRVWRVAVRAPHLGPTRKLLLLALLRAASDDDRYQRQCGQDDRSNADLLHLLSPS